MVNSCKICSSKVSGVIRRKERNSENIDLHYCGKCLYYFQDETGYKDIYTDGEFSILARKNLFPDKNKIESLDNKAKERIEFYKHHIYKANSILEIGSSIGSFVSLLKLANKEAVGIEPDKYYSNFSQKQYGFEQINVSVEKYDKNDVYDLICSFHVLEHIADIELFVNKCYDYLQFNGTLIIEVPSLETRSYNSLRYTFWKPHMHYFSLYSLYKLLRGKFEIIEYGHFGSAIYIVGLKTDKIQHKKNNGLWFMTYAKYYFSALLFNRFVPEKLRKVNQIIIQSVVQKKKFNANLKRLAKYFIYKIKEPLFLKKEEGRGRHKLHHVTNFKGWGNNIGDVILSKCVRDTYKNIDSFKWKITPVKNPVDTDLINQINKAKALVIGGGGLFLPDSNKNNISGWQWAISQELLKNIKIPIILYAVGYNFFRGQEPSSLFKDNLDQFLSHTSFIGIRNSGSIREINKLTNFNYKDQITFQPCPTTIINKIYRRTPKANITKKIAINLAFDRYNNRFGKSIHSTVNHIKEAVKLIQNRNIKIYIVQHISADNLFNMVLDADNIPYTSVALQYMYPRKVFEFYSNMDVVIGMRGHAQMIPFGLNVPIITLGSHDKMKWFLEDIDNLDAYVDLNNNTMVTENIVNAFDMIYQNHDHVVKELIEKQEILYNITNKNLELIKKYI